MGVGRDQQCLVYYEQKDIFRIYKHPHSSFQREIFDLKGSLMSLYSIYNGSLWLPLFVELCFHSTSNSKPTLENTPVEYILLPFGKKKLQN